MSDEVGALKKCESEQQECSGKSSTSHDTSRDGTLRHRKTDQTPIDEKSTNLHQDKSVLVRVNKIGKLVVSSFMAS